MKKLLICLMILSLLYAGEFSKNTITVAGQGVIYYAPNIAYVSLGAQDVYSDVSKGQQDISQRINKYLKAIKDQVQSEDIASQALQIHKKYEYVNRRQEFVGYQIQQMLRLTVRDLNQVGSLIDLAVSQGLNVLSSVAFSHTNIESFEQQALKKALENARQKAFIIKKTMNLQGMRVSNIRESTGGPNPLMERAGQMKALSAAPDTTTTVMPGQLSVQSLVTVKYSYLSAR